MQMMSTRRIGVLVGLCLPFTGIVGTAGCDAPLHWQCDSLNGSCSCYIVDYSTSSVIGSGGGPSGGICDTTSIAIANANCCFAVDADGDPGLCTCSAFACQSGFKSTKSCSDLAKYLQ